MEGLVKLRRSGENTFRRIRDEDTEELGEEIVFELEDGEAVRMWRHSNFSPKVR